MKRIVFALTVAVALGRSAMGGTAYWTGGGTDDRWANPDNWASSLLPTANDDVARSPDIFWFASTRQKTLTIDTPAAFRNITISDYGNPGQPFNVIRVLPGANVNSAQQSIDQYFGAYQQSGGVNRATGDFGYITHGGQFTITGGTLAAGGQMWLRPEGGTVTITGGDLEAGTVRLGYGWPARFSVAPSHAEIFQALELLGTEPLSMTVAGTFRMHGADLANQISANDHGLPGVVDVNLSGLNLEFDGSLQHLEVASRDVGPDLAAFSAPYALGGIEIGGTACPSTLQLVNSMSNWYLRPVPPEAAYVNQLVLDPGGLLDLNGQTLYAQSVVANGVPLLSPGTYGPGDLPFLTGSGGRLVLVPEPADALLFCLTLLIWRRR